MKERSHYLNLFSEKGIPLCFEKRSHIVSQNLCCLFEFVLVSNIGGPYLVVDDVDLVDLVDEYRKDRFCELEFGLFGGS